MFIQLQDYRLGHAFVSFAANEEGAARLEQDGLEYLTFSDGMVVHHPSGIAYMVDERSRDNLSQCDSFDVFEIRESGRAFRCFSDRSGDNAIFVTGRCNSACVMCPDSDKLRASSEIRDIESLLAQVRHIPSDVAHLTITGGEPFMLGENIFVLFEALKEKFSNTEFLLLSNGRIFSLPSYCARTAHTLPARTTIGIPVHGYDAASHDRITQVPGSFVQTITGIKNLLNLGMRIELRIVVSKISAEYMPQMAKLITRELDGIACVKIIGLEMLGNAAINEKMVWIPYRQAFEKSKPAIVDLVKHGIDVGLYNFPLCSVDESFWPICEKSISDYKIRFVEECDRCYVKDACGGVFAGTRRLAIQDIKALERPRR